MESNSGMLMLQHGRTREMLASMSTSLNVWIMLLLHMVHDGRVGEAAVKKPQTGSVIL